MTSISAQTLAQLQQENARLMALIGQQKQTIEQQKSSIETLQHQFHLFRTARFGRKSEKGVVPEQMALQFDETYVATEANTPEEGSEAQTQTITYTRPKKALAVKHCLNPYLISSRFTTFVPKKNTALVAVH